MMKNPFSFVYLICVHERESVCVRVCETPRSPVHVHVKCVSNMCKAPASMCGLQICTCLRFVLFVSRLCGLVWAANTNFPCLCVHSKM
jgi:hypothetical protein